MRRYIMWWVIFAVEYAAGSKHGCLDWDGKDYDSRSHLDMDPNEAWFRSKRMVAAFAKRVADEAIPPE